VSIDPAALSQYRDIMGAEANNFIVELIDTYIANSRELIAAIDSSFVSNDLVVFTRSTHTLKSNSAMFGAQALSTFCQELEQAGKNGEISGLQTRIDVLKIEHKQVLQELETLRGSLIV
jgi:HPt (histidine-containing phosphotransfer) domain-containing protein